MRTILLATSVLVAAAMLSSVAAEAPQLSEDKDKLVLENDHVRVWFQGKKPMLKVFPANASDDENATGAYGYQFRELVEYNDLDGDGLPSNNEIVSSLDLNKASGWTVARDEGEDNVTLTLSLVAPVKLGRELGLPTDNATGNLTLPGRDAPANVTLVFRIFETTSEVDNVTVPETAIKYDVVVASWPFVNADANRLGIELQVTGELEVDGDGATVVANDTAVGALTWVTSAAGTDAEGGDVDVPVRVGVANASEGASRLVFTYDAPGLASLVHDPTVGTMSGSEGIDPAAREEETSGGSPVPGPGALAAVGAVALAVALARRRA